MIVILQKPATEDDIKKASEEYKTYIKITLDLSKEIVALGGEYHFDAEQQLLQLGCRQTDIWGAGFDLVSKKIDTNAMINIRPKENESTEILDYQIRNHAIRIIRKYLSFYVQK